MFIFLQKVLIIDLNSFTISENKHLQHAVIFMLSWIIVIGLGRAKALLLRSSNSCIIGVPKILKFRGAENLRKVLFPPGRCAAPSERRNSPSVYLLQTETSRLKELPWMLTKQTPSDVLKFFNNFLR